MATLTRPVRGAPTAIESLPPPALLPALLAFPALLVLCAVDAGLAADTLFAGALVVAALLIAAAKARADTPPARPLLVAALAVFGAFCAWNYFSMLWAAAPSDAWEGANRALFYGLVLTLVGLRAWPRPAAETAFAVVGFGIGGMAAAVLGATAVMRDPSPLFFGGRLSEPTGYVNATAALWLVGLWPALHFSLSRSPRWLVRGLGLAVACLLLEMTLLT